MELILTRIAKRKAYTIGRLYLSPALPKGEGVPTEEDPARPSSPLGRSGEVYFCDTLEPTWRDYEHGAYKVKGHSAIPEGRYAVVISYSPKFKAWLPILLGGPEFNKQWQGIRIHAGNTVKDTQGCILVGRNPAIQREKSKLDSISEREQGRPEVNQRVGEVLESRKWLYELKQKIVEAKGRGEAVWLTIR